MTWIVWLPSVLVLLVLVGFFLADFNDDDPGMGYA